MDKPGGGGPALAAAGRGNVAYSNVSVNGGANEQESEHAADDSHDSRWASL